MLTSEDLREQIQLHLDGMMPLEDLAAWADEVFRDEVFEEEYAQEISDVLATLRDAVDPHRFRWEEPDFDEILEALEG